MDIKSGSGGGLSIEKYGAVAGELGALCKGRGLLRRCTHEPDTEKVH